MNLRFHTECSKALGHSFFFWHTVLKPRSNLRTCSGSYTQISHLLHSSAARVKQLLQKTTLTEGRASSECWGSKDSQRTQQGPGQHMGCECDHLTVTCAAQQAIRSRFGPDGAVRGVILVLASGNNHAWLSQVHGSLWRIGWDKPLTRSRWKHLLL